jgi:hypothetical protein
MSVLGPDGRPVAASSVKAEEKPGSCVLCIAEMNHPQRYDAGYDVFAYAAQYGLAQGYLVGIQVMASVLVGSGLAADKAVKVQEIASSFCPRHHVAVNALYVGESWRLAVERAVENIRTSNVFLVGGKVAQPGGAT